ncbi:hypothetical protein M433DRAFT_240870 [Acidomyces richmondensis BFW]|nr:hypothetical protein M433DRAFT_240870 [Acidomyces richmondensis BFW]
MKTPWIWTRRSAAHQHRSPSRAAQPSKPHPSCIVQAALHTLQPGGCLTEASRTPTRRPYVYPGDGLETGLARALAACRR